MKPKPLLAWPVAPFSAKQIKEATGCDLSVAEKRYPKALTVDALPGAFAPKTACDQAVLAVACGARVEHTTMTEPCRDAYRAAVRANPAMAFHSELARSYFGEVSPVAAPLAAQHALKTVTVDYAWTGLGQPVDWKLVIQDVAKNPKLAMTGSSAKQLKSPADLAATVAALGTSLEGFLPIPKLVKAVSCFDNYPEWKIALEFEGGEQLELTTNGSNVLGLGGPWQMTTGGVTYMQLSPGMVHAVGELVEELGLPIGEPEGEMCHGYDLIEAIR